MHRRFFIAWMLALGICGSFAPADAQQRIGRAAVVRNDVSQIAPRVMKISVGDEIFRDETVRTAADSDAKFVLRDDTNLSLGPGSTLKLDRAVFSGETNVGDVAVKLTSGAFRFVTGSSTKESYKIVTPLATIGVRGTTLDFLIQRFRNTVVLQDGQARVSAGGQFVDLLFPGDSVVITATAGKIQITKTSSPPWTFAGACAANSALCSRTRFADAAVIDVEFASALCGK
ncbi:FecR family protein [Bradyrhizobium sp.]|uniref:FecR family protein n=1 Tax=Bradyrhizobium sp. TaxID=376 RepID=UPI002E028C87|nr:FecR domain-containing protein [Bradyrhizobium sp.]